MAPLKRGVDISIRAWSLQVSLTLPGDFVWMRIHTSRIHNPPFHMNDGKQR